MTAKRFKCEFDGCHGYLFDDEYKTFYQLKDSEPNIELLCERLNELHEENNLLKDIIKDIVVQLDANHTSHTYQMTIPINKVIYNELKRRLKETSFNEELRRFLECL